MWTVFLFLLVLRLSRCTVDENYETKTVKVGDDVTFSCPHKSSRHPLQLFWFRLVSGALPEFLGRSYGDKNNQVFETPCCAAKQKAESFDLVISKTQLSQTGLYFCVGQTAQNVSVLKGVFLRVKEPGSDITKVIQGVSSDPARPGDSKTLQCSVLYDSDSKPCPGEPRVFWFRSGSDESGPSFIYTHGNRSDGCEKSSEAPSQQKCTYSFSESVSSSDEETFYCAVAACGEILLGNGTKIKAEVSGNNTCSTDIAVFVLSAALVICLIVIAFLIYTIKTKSSRIDDDLHKHDETGRDNQRSLQRDENSLIYAAPTFSEKKKIHKNKRRDVKNKEGEEETIYSGVRSV